MIMKSYPNFCIIEISKVNNLEEKEIEILLNYQLEFNKNEDANITQLFHGTSTEAVDDILENGFLKEKNMSSYGKGTYFSNDASYSIKYSNPKSSKNQRESHNLIFIIIADVIISDKSYSHTIIKELPSFFVNDIDNPKIYCVPHDKRAIPRYVVCFCSNIT